MALDIEAQNMVSVVRKPRDARARLHPEAREMVVLQPGPQRQVHPVGKDGNLVLRERAEKKIVSAEGVKVTLKLPRMSSDVSRNPSPHTKSCRFPHAM
jgi:limonene-1,2-epoxide hydrolase